MLFLDKNLYDINHSPEQNIINFINEGNIVAWIYLKYSYYTINIFFFYYRK